MTMSHDFDKDQKVSILITALQERYESMRAIRERVQSIGVWALGLLLAAGAWLIENSTPLTYTQKVIYILGAAVAFIVLRFYYLENLHLGFKGQQRVAARIEKALGLFTAGTFDTEKDSIYPESWEHAGKENGSGKFFEMSYLLLYVGVAFVIVAILRSPAPHHFFFKPF